MAELKIEKKSGMPHNLILEDRKKLVVSGVEDVDSFDEQTVVAYTAVGELMIKGEGLHINKLSLETGELTLDGEIASLTYTENRSSNGSFFPSCSGKDVTFWRLQWRANGSCFYTPGCWACFWEPIMMCSGLSAT